SDVVQGRTGSMLKVATRGGAQPRGRPAHRPRRQAGRRRLVALVLILAVAGVITAVAWVGSREESGLASRTPAVLAHRHAWRVPQLLDPANVYAADAAGRLSVVVRHDPALVYVPNSLSST